jgi:hypothetical protein
MASLHIVFVILAETTKLISTLPDDAFYYFQVAKNIGLGNGSTFDGIHATNGYHPLWQILLIPIFSLDLQPIDAVRFALTLQLAIATTTSILFAQMLRRFFKPPITLFALLLWYPLLFVRTLNGMETSLAIFFLVIACSMILNSGYATDARRSLSLGFILSLVMLSRLDMCFFVLPVLFSYGYSYKRKPIQDVLRSAALLCLGFSFLFLPYLAVNYFLFHELLPISGVIKSSFPSLAGNTVRTITQTSEFPLVNALIIFGAYIYLLWLHALRWSLPFRVSAFYQKVLTVLAVMVVTHSAYTFCFVRWGIYSWYFVPYSIFAVLLAVPAFEWLLDNVIRFKALFTFGACMILVVVALWRMQWTMRMDSRYNFASYNLSAVQWAKIHTLPTELFAYSDCGIFSFFSGRKVINLDGLMNNRDFQKVLREKGLSYYLNTNGVKYLIIYDPRPEQSYAHLRKYIQSISYFSSIFQVMSDTLELSESDKQFRIFRDSGPDMKAITIYKLPYAALHGS